MNIDHAIEIASRMGSPSHMDEPWAAALIALKSEVERLRAAQTPRPMEEAPNNKSILIHFKNGERVHGKIRVGAEVSHMDGWLPLPVDQGESDV